MKGCIRTGGFTRFDAIDKTKEYGCQGVELVLDDKTPDGSTPMEYAKALYAHAKEQGLEVPIYTTGANFFVKEPEKGAGTALQAYRYCGRMQDPTAAPRRRMGLL
ncbi:MAG: hypothetical protein ACLU3U_12795 [Gallintestinimicrobium sp.]